MSVACTWGLYMHVRLLKIRRFYRCCRAVFVAVLFTGNIPAQAARAARATGLVVVDADVPVGEARAVGERYRWPGPGRGGRCGGSR